MDTFVETVEIGQEVDRQVIKKWGNNEALRFTQKSNLSDLVPEGALVSIHRAKGGVFVKILQTDARPTLEERLARFDVNRHRGELMAAGLVGAEVF